MFGSDANRDLGNIQRGYYRVLELVLTPIGLTIKHSRKSADKINNCSGLRRFSSGRFMYRRMFDTSIRNAEIKNEITLSISGSGDSRFEWEAVKLQA